MTEVLTSCHCLCGYMHPDHRGICRSEEEGDIKFVPVPANSYTDRIPMCAPCRAVLPERFKVYRSVAELPEVHQDSGGALNLTNAADIAVVWPSA